MSEEFEYIIGIRLPLGKLLTPVKELEDSVSANLATFGYERERLVITSIVPMSLKVQRQLTEFELDLVKRTLTEKFTEQFGHASIEYIRSQSGNVPQLAIQ